MKFTTLLLCFLLGAQADTGAEVTACQNKVGISNATVADISKGRFDEPKLKTYLFCVNKAFRVQNENGELQHDVIRALFKEKNPVTNATIEEVLNCAKNRPDPEETALEYMKCLVPLVYRNPLANI